MTTPAIKTLLIIETRRGPCIAGTRITVFSVMDYLKDGWSRDAVKQALGISDEQLDAVLAYITRHKEAIENEYAAGCPGLGGPAKRKETPSRKTVLARCHSERRVLGSGSTTAKYQLFIRKISGVFLVQEV